MEPLGVSGRYREIAVIGHGGMATVKLAALPGPSGIQKLLVVKEALPHLASDPEFVAMFMDEARLASRFDHPNLIHTYEVGESAGRYFLVMEYLDGQPLSALMGRLKRQVPLPVYLRVLTRLLAGLHYAHELTDIHDKPLQVVHRDISPQNVFLCYGGAIKLVDFGIAKVVDAAVKTRTGVFKGKLAYASPEQITGDPVDRRSDIFTVGVMLWEGLTQQRLNGDLGEAAVIRRRLLGTEPKVSTENPSAPAELVAICEKAMALLPADRFPTAAEMQQRIEAYMASAGMTITDVEVGALVADAFLEERSTLRRTIQDRLAADATDAPLLALPLVLQEASSPSSVDQSAGGPPVARAYPTSAATLAGPLLAASAQVPPRRRTSRLGAGVVAFFAVAGVLATVVLARRAASPEASAASPSAQVAASASAASSVAPAEIQVFLSADPPTAQLSLEDGALPSNPYQGSRPQDPQLHTLTVSAPGYVTEQRSLTFERDVHIELSLHAVAVATTPSAASPRARTSDAPRSAPAKPGGLRFQHDRKDRPVDNENPYGATR